MNQANIMNHTDIVLLNWNSKEDTIECLESLHKMKGVSFRVFVCDNGSTDDSLPCLSRWATEQGVSHIEVRPGPQQIPEQTKLVLIDNGANLGFAAGNNTGIALAMVAAIKGYKMVLIMPSHMSDERKSAMTAYGAKLIEVTKEEGMERARDLALEMEQAGKGKVLNQFANADNPLAHYEGTGPELMSQTDGTITHFVSSMGTTGTIMGVARYFKAVKPEVEIVGLQPIEGSAIPGIRRWPEAYLPSIFDRSLVDRVIDMDQSMAEITMRRLAAEEGVFCGVSSGGAVAGALQLSQEVENATIVAVICDRGDRYLSTGVFDPPDNTVNPV